ncbi:transcriptional enhancer factor TEF-3 isoform 6-T6 [Odontesthes bonariensis]|uniref:transcriptional enhancer factor TEF-3 isoform X6 n=1 Tax=Odontesthes bonariensis TaxID=219752 RepID=UPI003F58BE08
MSHISSYEFLHFFCPPLLSFLLIPAVEGASSDFLRLSRNLFSAFYGNNVTAVRSKKLRPSGLIISAFIAALVLIQAGVLPAEATLSFHCHLPQNHPSFALWSPLCNPTTSAEWVPAPSPRGGSEELGDGLDKPLENDAEGVWSPDIEQSFQEALAIYPPCGRRKIILSDEGKMYGRNELIARYIKLRTGKTRTRKQVSSHIQVLARRKAREIQVKLKAHMVEEGLWPRHHKFWHGALPGQPGGHEDIKPFSQQSYAMQASGPAPITGYESTAGLSMSPGAPPWQGRSIASSKLRMLEFSAFLEQPQDPETFNKHLFVHIGQSNPSYSDPYLESVDIRQIYDKFPEKKGGLKELFDKGQHNAFFLVKFWADLSVNLQDDSSFFYGVSSQYESSENMIITSSTKVCSFGKQVVEKVETEYARFENGRYVFRIHRSPLCEYMINFIHKLKHLPEKYMMNSVLENFTILQVVTNRDTLETLLCIAYVFEVSTSEHGAQHHIYRLVKD